MTTANTARFNAEALSWDSNPSVQLATRLAHAAYLSRLPSPSELSTYDVLDLGCGTGLLSLALAPSVRSVSAVDAAEGMISALAAKLSSPELSSTVRNVHPVHALLQDPSDPRLAIDPVTGSSDPAPRRFHLVVSHLVLHHIPDLPALFRTMHGCLAPGGRVMVTDFENFGPEARRFHPEAKMDGVERHGIKRDEIKRVLEEAGFVDVKVETSFEMEKAVETEPGSGVMGPVMVFPFLICEGTKE
ncbi:S-adenosyl-L-methionine-dependent methyltransferase [Corynascus similis CBS 632.67]